MSTYRLDKILAPRSVALVGASPRETSVGRKILRNLREAGFAGPLHLVNPRHAEIDGFVAVRSIDRLEHAPDLVVIAAPPTTVPDIVAAAGARGCAGAVIITAGLGHGPNALAQKAAAAARAHGLRLIGPNCLGVMVPGARLNASFAASAPHAGDLALVSQSGAIAAGMVEWAARRKVGFSAVVSLGDQADVDLADCLDYFALDRATRAILLYVESVNDARKFMSAARAAARAKPVVELLPERAAERLRLLRQRAADLHAVIPEFESIREASMARVAAEHALKRLTNHPQEFGFGLKPKDRRVVEAQRVLDKANNDFNRVRELQEVRAAAWHTASQALANVEAWLRDGRPHGTVLENFEGPEPKLAKNEPGLLDAIENRRRKVREARASLHIIRSAPYPSSHAKRKMREMVEQLAQRGAPSMSLLIEHDRDEIAWPMTSVTSEVHAEQRALAFAEMPDLLALMAWLHKPALIAALDREIASESDDAAALTHEARQQQEAVVLGDLLAVERDECALVWQAQGLPVEHRSDINPVALLGLRLVTAPRADVPPETSAGWSWNLVGGGRR